MTRRSSYLTSVSLLCSGLLFTLTSFATQESAPEPFVPVETSKANPVSDVMPASLAAKTASAPQQLSGPIIAAGTQPNGALSGRVIYMSGGHGWLASGSTWALGRPLLLEMNEDTGNVDQMTLFAYYCFNAGATVVPFRPVGNQTNEVVIDNNSPAVTWSGAWTDSSYPVYYGTPSDPVPYRFTAFAATETATATYTPTIPQTDYYPVYCWTLGGNNRTNQLYRINHTGGQSLVRVPHNLVGGGWIYLGTYFLNAGSNAASGSVVISNLGEDGNTVGAVVADAIRFGNGMGDVDEGGGVSTYPREDEGNVYWVQRELGVGQPSSIYTAGNVSSPIRMAVEMNNESSGNMYKRAYVGFHSNASTGNPSTATARGVTALWNDPALVDPNSKTPNQYDYALKLAREVNNDMVALNSYLEVPWQSRSSLTYANPSFPYGEINNNVINDEFDATIVEVAFHDNTYDTMLLRDPKVRGWVAGAVCQGLVRYMNQYDGAPLVFLPESPWNARAISLGDAIRVSWDIPFSLVGASPATEYVVYRSSDGYGFGDPVVVEGGTANSLTVSNVVPGVDYYFRVAGRNPGGESMPSETVGCRIAPYPLSSRILIVNGFTRFDRTLNLRQTLAAENYKPPGHDHNTGGTDRVRPRSVNAFDYVVQHGKAVTAVSQMAFDSCQSRSVTNGTISLNGYDIVIWDAGNQSTKDRTFTPGAQSRIATFRANGGNLFVSGSDVAYDLGRQSGPTSSDRQFLTNQLHAALGPDSNNSAGVWNFSPVSGSIFAGNASGEFDDGGKGIYWVGSADALVPTQGATAILNYSGFNGGAAGIRYGGEAGDGKVAFFGFPFETITSASLRAAYMADILKDFSHPPVATFVEASGGAFHLSGTAEPGLSYQLEASTNMVNWDGLQTVQSTDGTLGFTDPIGGNTRRFYRIRTADTP